MAIEIELPDGKDPNEEQVVEIRKARLVELFGKERFERLFSDFKEFCELHKKELIRN